MIKPTQTDIGRKVVYAKNDQYRDTEYGVITGFNDRVVWVRYGTNQTSAATDPADLEFDA